MKERQLNKQLQRKPRPPHKDLKPKPYNMGWKGPETHTLKLSRTPRTKERQLKRQMQRKPRPPHKEKDRDN